MIEVFNELGRFAYLNPVGFAAKYRERFFFFRIYFFLQDMGVGDNVQAIRDNEAGATKDRWWSAGLLESPDGYDRRLNFFDGVSQILRLRYSLTQAKPEDEKFSFTSGKREKAFTTARRDSTARSPG